MSVEVSVIVPCYNAEHTIYRCLSSLNNQTYKNFEVIVIDDCSTDMSVEKVKKFALKTSLEIKIIKNNVNHGPSYSRKIGIQSAKGVYISFCDSDDYYESDYIEKMMEASNEKINDIVFCNYNSVYSNGNIKKHNCINRLVEKKAKQLIAHSVDSLWCMMVKKSVFKDLSFPNIRNGEDMAIIPILISRARKFGFSDKYLYNYVYSSDSLSRTFTTTMVSSLQVSFEYIEKELSAAYHNEIEFLGIKNYLYGAILNFMKNPVFPSFNETNEIIEWFENKYKRWYGNKYMKTLPLYKKIYLFSVKHRLYYICRLLSLVHKQISK